MSIDTDCICRGCTNHFLCIFLTIVNFQNGNLKRSAMWVSNQSNSLTIFIVRCIDLIIFHRSYRQNNMILLTWQSRCIQMNCSRIAVISKRLKKSLFNRWVLKCHDFRELIGFISLCNIQLFLRQIKTLFRKKLRGDAVRPFRPVCFFTGLVNERQLLFSILVCVIALTTMLFHKRAKRIGRIILDRFQNLLHRRTDRFVGIEPNIDALWKII